LLGANKDVAVEANADGKPNTAAGILFMSRNQNSGQILNIIRSNKLYEDVEKLKCLRTTVKRKNCAYAENENIKFKECSLLSEHFTLHSNA